MRPHRNSLGRLNRVVLVLTAGLLALPGGYRSAADQEEPPEPKQQNTLARFITVASPIEDGKITNTALKLQSEAARESLSAVLVLEITRGSDKFGPIYELAKFLTEDLPNVRTVAWIPETVDGNKVVLALACQEIVMHPDAELGDIGRGQPVDQVDRDFVLSLVKKRHNAKLSRALVLGMMDRQEAVLKIRTGDADQSETQVVTEDELKRKRDAGVIIKDVETIKERGVIGTFSGRQARDHDILVVQTAETRGEVADLYNLPAESLRDEPTGEAPKPFLIKVNGMIEPVLETFIERQIDRALGRGANLLIFEVDSPGGFLLSSTNLAHKIADLDPKKVRTVAYIGKDQEAMSGAAIVSLGCDEIYMHPGAQIGDAGPIEMREGGQFQHAEEKILSPLRLTLKDLADRKNRPAAVAMSMADRNLQVYQVTNKETGKVWYMSDDEIHNGNGVWIKGQLVAASKEGLLLTVNGEEAHELKLAEPPVQDLDELKQRLDLPADAKLVAVEKTALDTLIFVLNTSAALSVLLVIAIVCIYIEAHFVSGLFGIISALCFTLLFWSRFLGGTAGWLEVVLFLLGLACMGLEIFVIPGFGVFGISGGLLVFASLILASQTFGDFNPREPNADFNNVARTMGAMSVSVVSVVVLAMLMSRYLPRMPLLSHVILAPPGTVEGHDPDEPHLRPEYADDPSPTAAIEQDASLVGKQGAAVSTLRPAGKAQIDGRYLDVVSDGPYIQQGQQIEVVSVSGNRVVVRQVS